MASSKPGLPSGFRDFTPTELKNRNYILNTIKGVFVAYGFNQIETPAVEKLKVLTGKYGDEGDKLIFKILNSGDYMRKAPDSHDASTLLPHISEKALRYDLTVPFARYVVNHRNEINLPFKRYQIQPVWRADRPQRGRYREFLQCDADVVGTESLICEAEIVLMVHAVFGKLQLNSARLKVNNRKILAGLAQAAGQPGKETPLCVAIDKIDKIGIDSTLAELQTEGFDTEALTLIKPLLTDHVDTNNSARLNNLKMAVGNTQMGAKGIAELEELMSLLGNAGFDANKIDIDPTLARGLNYYTGAIFEVKAPDVPVGSLCGGGRYDNLTGLFGWPDVSGVGFSFGVDRIYDALEHKNLLPKHNPEGTKVLIAYFGTEGLTAAFGLATQLRQAGIVTEMYPDNVKLKKQLAYADKCNIPFVALAGPEELTQKTWQLKNLQTGAQNTLPDSDVVAFVNQFIDNENRIG